MEPRDDTKLRELILYLAKKCEGDLAFAKTKLCKLLFYSDFGAFVELGSSITGQPYVKLPNGPVPPRATRLLTKMEKAGELAMAKRSFHGHPQEKPMALREPDLSLFTGAEIALVDVVIDQLRDHNARGVSDLSHDFIGWQAAAMGEEIPYETALVDVSPATEDEIAYARQLVSAGR
jgi:hypothetical protein